VLFRAVYRHLRRDTTRADRQSLRKHRWRGCRPVRPDGPATPAGGEL